MKLFQKILCHKTAKASVQTLKLLMEIAFIIALNVLSLKVKTAVAFL